MMLHTQTLSMQFFLFAFVCKGTRNSYLYHSSLNVKNIVRFLLVCVYESSVFLLHNGDWIIINVEFSLLCVHSVSLIILCIMPIIIFEMMVCYLIINLCHIFPCYAFIICPFVLASWPPLMHADRWFRIQFVKRLRLSLVNCCHGSFKIRSRFP